MEIALYGNIVWTYTHVIWFCMLDHRQPHLEANLGILWLDETIKKLQYYIIMIFAHCAALIL